MNHSLTIDLYAFFLGIFFVVTTYGLYNFFIYIQKCITGFQTEYYEIKELLKRTCDSIAVIQATANTGRSTITSTLSAFYIFLSDLLQLYAHNLRPTLVPTHRPQTSMPTQSEYGSNIDEFIRAQQHAINETQRRVDEAMTSQPTQSHYDSDTNSETSTLQNDERSEHERLQRLLEA